MEIITEGSKRISASVVTLGTFDGVHCGHKYLIDETVRVARERGVPSVVVTFDILPKAFFGACETPYKLSTTVEKAAIMEQCGVDYMYILTFNEQLTRLSPIEFLETYLVGQLGVRHFVMGYNHRFGQGTYPAQYYEEICRERGIGASRVEQWVVDGDICSSSEIRKMLHEGNVTKASQLLGHNYTIEGIVVHGDALGRSIGFPTANVQMTDKDKIVPADGVYEATVQVGGQTYRAAVFIGTRATLNCDKRRIEAYIIDFSDVIYGNLMLISFVSRRRGVKQFNSLEELREQIKRDVAFKKN